MNNWRLPTVSELEFIYANRDALDLQTGNSALFEDDGDPLYGPSRYWLSGDYVDCWTVSSQINRPYGYDFRSNVGLNLMCAINWSSNYLIYLMPVIQL